MRRTQAEAGDDGSSSSKLASGVGSDPKVHLFGSAFLEETCPNCPTANVAVHRRTVFYRLWVRRTARERRWISIGALVLCVILLGLTARSMSASLRFTPTLAPETSAPKVVEDTPPPTLSEAELQQLEEAKKRREMELATETLFAERKQRKAGAVRSGLPDFDLMRRSLKAIVLEDVMYLRRASFSEVALKRRPRRNRPENGDEGGGEGGGGGESPDATQAGLINPRTGVRYDDIGQYNYFVTYPPVAKRKSDDDTGGVEMANVVVERFVLFDGGFDASVVGLKAASPREGEGEGNAVKEAEVKPGRKADSKQQKLIHPDTFTAVDSAKFLRLRSRSDVASFISPSSPDASQAGEPKPSVKDASRTYGKAYRIGVVVEVGSCLLSPWSTFNHWLIPVYQLLQSHSLLPWMKQLLQEKHQSKSQRQRQTKGVEGGLDRALQSLELIIRAPQGPTFDGGFGSSGYCPTVNLFGYPYGLNVKSHPWLFPLQRWLKNAKLDSIQQPGQNTETETDGEKGPGLPASSLLVFEEQTSTRRAILAKSLRAAATLPATVPVGLVQPINRTSYYSHLLLDGADYRCGGPSPGFPFNHQPAQTALGRAGYPYIEGGLPIEALLSCRRLFSEMTEIYDLMIGFDPKRMLSDTTPREDADDPTQNVEGEASTREPPPPARDFEEAAVDGELSSSDAAQPPTLRKAKMGAPWEPIHAGETTAGPSQQELECPLMLLLLDEPVSGVGGAESPPMVHDSSLLAATLSSSLPACGRAVEVNSQWSRGHLAELLMYQAGVKKDNDYWLKRYTKLRKLFDASSVSLGEDPNAVELYMLFRLATVVVVARGMPMAPMVAFLRPGAGVLTLSQTHMSIEVSPTTGNYPWWPFYVARPDLFARLELCRAFPADPDGYTKERHHDCKQKTAAACDFECDRGKVSRSLLALLAQMKNVTEPKAERRMRYTIDEAIHHGALSLPSVKKVGIGGAAFSWFFDNSG